MTNPHRVERYGARSVGHTPSFSRPSEVIISRSRSRGRKAPPPKGSASTGGPAAGYLFDLTREYSTAVLIADGANVAGMAMALTMPRHGWRERG